MILEFMKTRETAKSPERANPSDAGLDVFFCPEDRESIKLVGDYVSSLKKEFKGATDKTLKLKEVSSTDSIELINYNTFSPVRQVYYRRNTVYDVSA